MSEKRHSIIVIDDHPIIHDGLKTLLAHEKEYRIDYSATSASEALNLLKEIQPDLAIIDLSLGDSDGAYLVQKINSRYPKLKMIVYTMSEERLFAERVACAGASGYVMKTAGPEILKMAIHTVLAGERFFSPESLKRILAAESPAIRRKQQQHRNTILETLSNREMDIFMLIGQGLNTREISERLNIRPNTVDTHRINIKNKLDLKSSKETDRMAYQFVQTGKLPSPFSA
jgi:two-component system, NarL family, response regulator NreC